MTEVTPDEIEALEPRGEHAVLAGIAVEICPASLRQLPALRRLTAAAAEVLAAGDLAAAVEARAEALAADLARLLGTGPEVWDEAPWGETVIAVLAVLRVNRAYVAGPFTSRIAAETAAIRTGAGAG